jgi:hypothetical protein
MELPGAGADETTGKCVSLSVRYNKIHSIIADTGVILGLKHMTGISDRLTKGNTTSVLFFVRRKKGSAATLSD